MIQLGILAKNVEDVLNVFNIIKGEGKGGLDPYVLNNLNKIEEKDINKDIKNMKIAVIKELVDLLNEDVKARFLASIKELEELGCKVEEIHFPYLNEAISVFSSVSMADLSSDMARYDGIRFGTREEGSDFDEIATNTRTKNLGFEAKRRIILRNIYSSKRKL